VYHHLDKEEGAMRLIAWIASGFVLAGLLLGSGPAGAQTTFVFANQGEPVSLDPAIITDGISNRITRQIYQGLVRYKGATTEVIPALAEKWELSKDGTVWTFTLRKGVKFHDGNPFDAAAVAWNFDRWRLSKHPQHENQTKAGQTFEYYEAQFGGFDEKSLITKVEAVNPTTVRITLKAPQGPFLANLAMFVFDLVSPKAVEKWGTEFGKHPVGAGPFKFVEWKVGQEVILEPNKDYWDKANLPKIQRLVIRNIKDNSQRLAALKAGEVQGFEGLNPDDVKVVRADPNLQILLRPTNTTGYVAFNYRVKEFRDARVRQAIAHAINKKGIVDALYGGTGMVATQFQPPPLWGYNKELKDYAYNPEQAKSLLKDAGFGQGLKEITWEDGKREPLQFWYMPVSRPYFPNPKEIAEAIAADLAKSGITVQLQTTDWTVYLDKRKNGQLPLYMLGWTGDNGDPDNFVCYFFCSPGASREGFYANQPLTDILLEAQKLTDQKKRAELYRKAEQMIHDDVARIFIANNQPPLPFRKNVKGYVPNPTNSEFFNTVSIEK
jgi:peptide/nickel transport system substrate-binding protein